VPFYRRQATPATPTVAHTASRLKALRINWNKTLEELDLAVRETAHWEGCPRGTPPFHRKVFEATEDYYGTCPTTAEIDKSLNLLTYALGL
jgi:hypothetical protein